MAGTASVRHWSPWRRMKSGGELTFIEKARGIHKARMIYEEQLSKSVSMRELSSLLTEQGLPVDASSISRMENTPEIPVSVDPRTSGIRNGESSGQGFTVSPAGCGTYLGTVCGGNRERGGILTACLVNAAANSIHRSSGHWRCSGMS